MSRTQFPLGPEGQDAMAVLRLASAWEQSELPKVQEISGGQHAGQGVSGLGGTSGQGGAGGAFEPTFQAPLEQRASRVPHWPKSHVVPSGRRHALPLGGSFVGQSAIATWPPSSPSSGGRGTFTASSPHAPATAAEVEQRTSTAASWASAGRRDVTRPE